ncbi:MAG: YibE/F family protein [Spirochaetaceae bacterium]
MKKLQNITVILHGRFFLVGIILINFIIVFLSLEFFQPQKYFSQTFVFGKVMSVKSETLDLDPYVSGRQLGIQDLVIEILTGTQRAETYNISNTLSKGHNVLGEEGKTYIFSIRTEPDGKLVVWLYSYNRIPLLAGLLLLFLFLVIFIAGRQGFRSLVALSFTGVMLLFVLVPLILNGFDPMGLSILILSVITVVSFILLTGFSKKSLIAILGTIGGIVVAGLISYITSKIAHLSGVNMEKGEQILYIAKDFGIRINGFLFIAILIASSGAVMDVAMSLTSALDEIQKHKPLITTKELFKSGMSIGRDLIGTMINTLILAFTGSSFTLILMIAGLSMSFTQFINIPLISIEIIQALAGSIGIILTVPLTNIIFIIVTKEEKQK